MSTAVAIRRSSVSVRTFFLLIALVAAFVIGGAGGYIVRGMTTPATVTAQQSGTLCAAGRHVVVWYTAHVWTCEATGPG
jgi:hypothetical protein